MAVPLDVVQHEHLPRSRRERRDGMLEIEPHFRPPPAPGSLERRRVVGRHDPLLPPPLGTPSEEHLVHGEPVEPRGECALAPERAEPLPRPNELPDGREFTRAPAARADRSSRRAPRMSPAAWPPRRSPTRPPRPPAVRAGGGAR